MRFPSVVRKRTKLWPELDDDDVSFFFWRTREKKERNTKVTVEIEGSTLSLSLSLSASSSSANSKGFLIEGGGARIGVQPIGTGRGRSLATRWNVQASGDEWITRGVFFSLQQMMNNKKKKNFFFEIWRRGPDETERRRERRLMDNFFFFTFFFGLFFFSSRVGRVFQMPPGWEEATAVKKKTLKKKTNQENSEWEQYGKTWWFQFNLALLRKKNSKNQFKLGQTRYNPVKSSKTLRNP